ncbi:MAG TPA: hypothetical protein VN714_28085 [Trebonia sp.]|nr:hypothetical protein [Trebonia sp.]
MTSPASKITGSLLFLVISACALGGCAGASAASSGGSGGSGGTVGTCATAPCLVQLPSTWIAEIDPPGNSTAAVTFDSSDLAKQNPTFRADAQASVTVTFAAPSNAPVPSKATAILTLPSPIAGRPPLTFQAPTAVSAAGVLTASLAVPKALLGSPATLTLVPLPPADQQNPPYTFSVALGSTMPVAIATDNFTINSALQTGAGLAPATTFVAQAFQGGALVSNAPLTQQTDGSFQLLIPSAVLASGQPLTVQLTPQSTTDPWFVSVPLTFSNATPPALPPQIMLSGSNTGPTYFSAIVQGSGSEAVAGAVVQAQATLGTNSYGSTQFSRAATTGDGTAMTTAGVATLSLIPATDPKVTYSFAVVPPASSRFATTCFSSVAVQGGGATAAGASPIQPAFIVGQRAVLNWVVSAAGARLANVSVTATPGPDPVPGCASTPAAPASATTGANGNFSLALDPGTYQIDYDPPAGSAAARLTAYGVVIGGYNQAPAPAPIDLEAAGWFEGTVLAPDNATPLASATVRIYEPRCSGSACAPSNDPPAPRLRAQAVTDANGFFRVAVQPNN